MLMQHCSYYNHTFLNIKNSTQVHLATLMLSIKVKAPAFLYICHLLSVQAGTLDGLCSFCHFLLQNSVTF